MEFEFSLFEGKLDDASLTERFGHPMPARWVELVHWIVSNANDGSGDAEDLYRQWFHFDARRCNAFECTAPMELLGIGVQDNIILGPLVLAPELGHRENPWAWYCSDGSFTSIVAVGATRIIENVLSRALVEYEHFRETAKQAAAALNVDISVDRGRRVGGSCGTDVDELGYEDAIIVPPGYRYLPPPEREDSHVGVLAPTATFAEVDPIYDCRSDLITMDIEYLQQDYPATALWLLTGDSARYQDAVPASRWTEATQAAYRALGRDQYAQRLDDPGIWW